MRVEAVFHMTPHFAYPLMVALAVLLLPMLLVMPASSPLGVALDLSLMFASTGSLLTFYVVAERSAGRSAWGALRRLPWLLAIGSGMSPWLTKAVWQGLQSETGEFVRTPKKGDKARQGRYKARTSLPWIEMLIAGESAAAVVAAFATHHYIAAPFATLFLMGFGYVSVMVCRERFASAPTALPERASEPSIVTMPVFESDERATDSAAA